MNWLFCLLKPSAYIASSAIKLILFCEYQYFLVVPLIIMKLYVGKFKTKF